MNCEAVPLREVLEVQNGFAFKTEFFGEADGVPLIRIRDLGASTTETNYAGDYRDEFLVEPGELLIGMDGNFRCRRWAGPRALLNQRVCRLRNFSSRVVSEYVYYAIQPRLDAIESRTSFATVKHLSAKQILEIEIPLPSVGEQRRIVDLLARAEGIVRLRREAQQKAAELIPAIFIDMFGNPATNPKQLPLRSVRELVARFEGGKNLQAGSDGGTDFRILKVSAVTSGEYVETESKPTPNGYEPPQNHVVRENDMLFSRANTEELVGATAVVRATNGRTLLPDKLWRFVWAEPVEQAFMHALFHSAHVRRELGKLSSGTSASMRNISQAKLFELRLPIPSLEKQRAFGRRADAAQSIRSQQEVALAKAEATFDALLSRAFS